MLNVFWEELGGQEGIGGRWIVLYLPKAGRADGVYRMVRTRVCCESKQVFEVYAVSVVKDCMVRQTENE